MRQIPLTPGGLSLIEATLLAGLIAAGAATTPAAAAVLIYRCLSCWATIPIGILGWLAFWQTARRRDPALVPARTGAW